ncbi:hypothetical protein CN326_14900 [Bacillus sp. AFS018417]|uniref:hypothetical protein n=1 Tax=Bacillus sp. AFS018417 TaxID=2033491 RepID=UPI000BF2BA8C|nr:hypothetical protein [Bacillus sp. AFS018417]PEZ05297.1 hypothetical protein CN326_14900 [Bacillus sp. AFS018417]
METVKGSKERIVSFFKISSLIIVWVSVFISALYFLAGLILPIISLLVIVGLVAVGLYYIWNIGCAIAAFAIILVGIFMALGVLYKFSTYLGS